MLEGLLLMLNQFNIAEVYQRVFGISQLITYNEFVDQAQQLPINFEGIEVVDYSDIEQETSYLGLPIFFPITLKGGTYKYLSNGVVAKKQLKDFRLPATCVASFNRRKIKAKTRTSGGEGSVKELYGFDDWQITIKGICLDDPGHPQGAKTFLEQHQRLLEFESLTDSILVEGSLFRAKGIYRMDIDEIDFPSTIGKGRYMAFSITGESDEPLELIL